MTGITEGYVTRHYQGIRGARDDGRRATLVVDTPFGRPNIAAKIELARHPLSLPVELLASIPVPIQRLYGFDTPAVPVVNQAEAIAEKLARFRRVDLARDLYDLA